MTYLEAFVELDPINQFTIVVCVTMMAFAIVKWPLHVYRMHLRHRTIREKGWPPPHLDADGDNIVND